MSPSQTSESPDDAAIADATAADAATIMDFSQTTTVPVPKTHPLTPLNSSHISSPMPSSPSEPGEDDNDDNTDKVTGLFGDRTGDSDYTVADFSVQQLVMHFLGDRIDKNNRSNAESCL